MRVYARNQFELRVEKGERGIRILAPTQRKPDSEAYQDIRAQNQPVLVGFRSVCVFDVSQTDGNDLPQLDAHV